MEMISKPYFLFAMYIILKIVGWLWKKRHPPPHGSWTPYGSDSSIIIRFPFWFLTWTLYFITALIHGLSYQKHHGKQRETTFTSICISDRIGTTLKIILNAHRSQHKEVVAMVRHIRVKVWNHPSLVSTLPAVMNKVSKNEQDCPESHELQK